MVNQLDMFQVGIVMDLPIEQKVEEKIGSLLRKKSLPKSKLRQLCRDHASRFVDIQRDEFKKLRCNC